MVQDRACGTQSLKVPGTMKGVPNWGISTRKQVAENKASSSHLLLAKRTQPKPTAATSWICIPYQHQGNSLQHELTLPYQVFTEEQWPLILSVYLLHTKSLPKSFTLLFHPITPRTWWAVYKLNLKELLSAWTHRLPSVLCPNKLIFSSHFPRNFVMCSHLKILGRHPALV